MYEPDIDGSVQDCSSSIDDALELAVFHCAMEMT